MGGEGGGGDSDWGSVITDSDKSELSGAGDGCYCITEVDSSLR